MENEEKSCSSSDEPIRSFELLFNDSLERPFKILKRDSGNHQEVNREERLKTLKVLVSLGAVVDQEDLAGLTPLFHAVRSNDIELIGDLVSIGANINYASEADNLFYGGTSLHQAAAKANVETVRVLLELGAQVGLEDHFGKTALHWAAWEGRAETIKLLAARGGDLSAEDSWDRSLLHMAADGGHASVTEWLLQSGADPNAKCSEDNTPLHYAAVGGHVGVIRLLLPHCTLDARDILGRTPLMCAVRYGRAKAVRLLLTSGADPCNKDDFGVSVIDWTADLESSEIATILNCAINEFKNSVID